MKKINLFSDGSCLGNPGSGGWATILDYNGNRKVLSGGKKLTTNNYMELLAVIKGLEALKEPCYVDIYSDSSYVVKGINEWLKNWERNSWKNSSKKDISNKELWQRLNELLKVHKVKAFWVKGHNGHKENEECDKIASQEALKWKKN